MDICKRRETIVVTGGAGFLGQHIVRQLLEQTLFPLQEIRVFDIQEFKWFPGMEPYINNSKAKLKPIKGDIRHIEELQNAFEDATTVIHSAAVVDVTTLPDKANIQLVNIKGTENVIQACIDNNIEKLIYTSSVDAFLSPDPFPTSEISEAQVPTPTKFLMGPYAASKFKADRLIVEANNRPLKNGKRLQTCALRVPYTYGEGDVNVQDLMKQPAKIKKFYPIGRITNDYKVQKIYAGNSAWAHVLAVEKLSDHKADPSPAGKSMFVGDNTPLFSLSGHLQEFVNRFGANVGPHISFRIIYVAGFIIECLAWLLQPVYSLRSPVTTSLTIFARNNYTVSWELSRRCLGYSPIFTYDRSIDRSWVYLKETLLGQNQEC